MEFTLYYKGPLKSNGNKEHKHEIRKYFHPQLFKLWKQEPLSNFTSFLESWDNDVVTQMTEFQFTSIINRKFHLVAELDIIFLRPEPIGNIITSGGDIDNRIKTLLDALKVPGSLDELPKGLKQSDFDRPIYCLLRDDSLISSIKITTKQLLASDDDSGDVILIINVVAKKISTMMGGMELP